MQETYWELTYFGVDGDGWGWFTERYDDPDEAWAAWDEARDTKQEPALAEITVLAGSRRPPL